MNFTFDNRGASTEVIEKVKQDTKEFNYKGVEKDLICLFQMKTDIEVIEGNVISANAEVFQYGWNTTSYYVEMIIKGIGTGYEKFQEIRFMVDQNMKVGQYSDDASNDSKIYTLTK